MDYLLQALAAAAAGQLPDPALKAFKVFPVNPNPGLATHMEIGESREFA